MNSTAKPNFHPELEPVLRRLRGRIRRVQSARGALVTLVAALAVLAALIAIDVRLSPLPLVARWILTLSWFATVVGVALVAWFLPMRKPLELLRIARWLEVKHPELDERVSTALELSGTGGSGVSGALLEELSRAAVADLAAIDPRTEISMRRAKRWLAPALGLLAGWTALFVWAPQWTARHVVRALVPNSRLGNVADGFVVEPGSVELIEGDALTVSVRCPAAPAVPPEIVLSLADGKSLVEPLREENGAFFYQLDRVTAGFDYEIRAGRANSDRFRVLVWPKPRLADARLRLEFPAYTGLAPREQSAADVLTAVAGTRVALHANLNTPVAAAKFELDGCPSGPVRLEHSAAGGSLDCGWTLDRPGRAGALLTLSHRLGRDFEGARFEVETLEDAVPEVKWTRPTAQELKVRPDEVLDLVYQASDDFGLGEVAMEVKPGDAPETALPQPLPELIRKADPPAWRGEIRQPLGDLRDRWPGVSVFKLRMRVADARPPELGGANKAVSGWLTVRINRDAEPLAKQELFAAHNDARETLEKARRDVEEARWKIESKRDELKKGDVKEASQNELAKTREQLAKASERLEELAARMEETPHAPKAEAMREAAAKAEQAREKLENTPLQDSEQAREQMAAAARDDAAEAEKQLRDLLEKVQQDESRLHDLARLQELAQRQNELARQAEQASANEPSDKPNKEEADWQQRQAQASWEMRDLAAQHPQSKAEALAKEAAEARELAAEAREQAAAQQALKEQAAESNQGKPSADDLRQELAKEQAAIRDDANKQVESATERGDREAANSLPEAARAAAEAADALAKDDPAAGVEATSEAAKEMAAAAEAAKAQSDPQGDNQPGGENPQGEQPNGSPQQAAVAQAAAELRDLAERQQQVAEAAKELAAGNEEAARQQLAKMRAEQAAELAKDIREVPQVGDTPGAMQQAADAANQAAGHAANAAQQAEAAQAATPHGEAAERLQQAAASLDQAATELSNQAAQSAGQQAPDNQAPMPGKSLADAFHESAEASHSPPGAESATHARAAADALNRAARDTRNAMRQGQGPPKPGAGDQPGQPDPNADPGTKPDENSRQRQADPGVPPELAKLGISAEDWEQIKSSLKAESGGNGAVPMPEEYRDLVRKYFEQMTKGGKDD